jgi:alanine-glyoxylate transaminase/serine-glyoxylate transaminase/serine-pyruvate transaminase
MSLNHGRTLLAIPGPSVIPERVLNAMHRASPNIYEGELIDLTASIYPDLQSIARTEGAAVIYIGNGHAAWEAALCNTLSRRDRILILATGLFALGWAEMAQVLGLDVRILDFGTDADADPARVEQELREDTEHRIKAVLTVQTDTASSVKNDVPKLRRAIDAAGHPALFMVDCIASLACDHFEMDGWGVDVAVSACQKGLMTPAGISFLFFNEKADRARDSAGLVTRYWDWRPRAAAEVFSHRFGGTAPTHHLFGLREALNMLLYEEGLEAVWNRHKLFARAVWAAIDAWGAGGNMRLNIREEAKRSSAVTTIWTGAGEAKRLRAWTEHEAGLTLGLGLLLRKGENADRGDLFRIGHMGHLNIPMVMATLGTIDAGLKTLGIPHGDGGLAAATRVIADYER